MKLAIVTGGSGGIGSAVCTELRRRGYEVRSWSRSDGVDVGDEAQVEAAFAALPRLDVLVNNAAFLRTSPVEEMTSETWDETLRVGLRGAFLCSRGAFRLMREGGAIVMVSSLSGYPGAEKFPGMSAYVAAKSGLAGLTEALAVEGRARSIRVNAVSPGSVDTPMLRLTGVPPQPVLRPEQVASVVGWLASEESAPLSGANLRLDAPG